MTAGTRDEINWVTENMGRVFPEAWHAFRTASGAQEGERTIDAFLRLITHPGPSVRIAAANAWMEWEDTHVSLNPAGVGLRNSDAAFRPNFATLVIHYWANDCFLPDDAVMKNMNKLVGIPGTLIHGRYDVSSPAIAAWHPHQLWSESAVAGQ